MYVTLDSCEQIALKHAPKLTVLNKNNILCETAT